MLRKIGGQTTSTTECLYVGVYVVVCCGLTHLKRYPFQYTISIVLLIRFPAPYKVQMPDGTVRPIQCTKEFTVDPDEDDDYFGERADQVTACQVSRMMTIAAIFFGVFGVASKKKP